MLGLLGESFFYNFTSILRERTEEDFKDTFP